MAKTIVACTICKKPLERETWRVRAGQRKGVAPYCSATCLGVRHHQNRRSVRERFDESYVIEPNCGCWLWIGEYQNSGYGILRSVGTSKGRRSAHRLSWELHHGEVAAGLWVLHKCDVKICVNPAHLYLGTAAQNSADAVARNRGTGSQSTLSEEAWSAVAVSKLSAKALAAELGVSEGIIHYTRKQLRERGTTLARAHRAPGRSTSDLSKMVEEASRG